MGRGVEEGAEPRGPLPVAWESSAGYLTPPLTFYTESSLRRKHKILTLSTINRLPCASNKSTDCGTSVIEPNHCQIDPNLVASLYVRHADELRAFLFGVLRDSHLVNDVLQSAFVKAIEKGHTAQEESLKSWLFQVAYREALVVRRSSAVHVKATERIAQAGLPQTETPDGIALRSELLSTVQHAIGALPTKQQQIVRLRMYDGMKFAEIAKKLKLPLGTVLARMQAALKRLKTSLED